MTDPAQLGQQLTAPASLRSASGAGRRPPHRPPPHAAAQQAAVPRRIEATIGAARGLRLAERLLGDRVLAFLDMKAGTPRPSSPAARQIVDFSSMASPTNTMAWTLLLWVSRWRADDLADLGVAAAARCAT